MLPRVAGAAPPPIKPWRQGGRFISFGVFPSRPPWKILPCVPTLPSSCSPHPTPPRPTPPHPRIYVLELTDGEGEEKEQEPERAGWGGQTFSVGGRVLGSARGKPGGGVCVLWPPLPAAAGAALDGRAWVGERAGRAGEHPTRPLPGRHERRAPPPPQANSGPSHGDQSERGWLGGKPREAFISARVAAGSCQDRLPVLQRNGLSRPPPGGTPPCGGVPSLPSFRGDKMESRWLPGGLLVWPARVSPLVPPSRRLGASLPPLWHTHTRGTVQTGACCLGERRGWAHRHACADRRARGEAGGGALEGW